MFDADHKKSIISGELRSTPNEILIAIADKSSKIRELLKEATIQVETAPRSLTISPMSKVKKIAVMACTAKLAAETGWKKIDDSEKDLVLSTPSPVPSTLYYSSGENQREQKYEMSKKKK